MTAVGLETPAAERAAGVSRTPSLIKVMGVRSANDKIVMTEKRLILSC